MGGIVRHNLGTCNPIYKAKVPLIKFVDNLTGLRCDITVNGILQVKNSTLFLRYGEYDERFKVLGFFIKAWAKANNILGGDRGGLTSYALLNMVAFYLQSLNPPVLPCLQKIWLSSKTGKKEEVEYLVNATTKASAIAITRRKDASPEIYFIKTDVYFENDLKKVKEYMKEYNSANISKLISGFFYFYSSEFDVHFH